MKARKAGLFTVMIGALALSFSGQVHAVTPLLGTGMGVVLALTNDLATILALAEATATGASASVRRWAWSVLLLAGGTALGLNTWHALASHVLPAPAAVAVGAGPVVLAWLLSHLVALVVGQHAESDAEARAGSAPASAPNGVSGAAQPASPASVTTEPAASLREATPAEMTAPLPRVAASASRTEAPVDDEVPDLVARAERLERQALDETGRGISYRKAARRLGVRFDAAKTAVNAARERIQSETEHIDHLAA